MKLLLAAALTMCIAMAQSPTTVIHIINVKWKAEATPGANPKPPVDAAHQCSGEIPPESEARLDQGTSSIRARKAINEPIVMEFRSQAALTKYADSAAQKWWCDISPCPSREEKATPTTSPTNANNIPPRRIPTRCIPNR